MDTQKSDHRRQPRIQYTFNQIGEICQLIEQTFFCARRVTSDPNIIVTTKKYNKQVYQIFLWPTKKFKNLRIG